MTDQVFGSILWDIFVIDSARICEQLMVQGQSRSTAVLHSGIQHLLKINSNIRLVFKVSNGNS